jgi:hypothetical protein
MENRGRRRWLHRRQNRVLGTPKKNSGSGAFVGITKTAGWRPCNDFLVQGRGIRFHGRPHVGFNNPLPLRTVYFPSRPRHNPRLLRAF